MRTLIALVVVGAILSAPAPAPARMSTSTPCLATNSCVVGYLADWGLPLATLATSTYLKNVDFVHYAFATPNPDGTITPPFNAGSNPTAFRAAVAAARAQNPGLKIVISVGGAGSANTAAFASIAASAGLRSTFASAVAALVTGGGFDGVDIDWEFPQAGDKSNFTALLQSVRAAIGAGAYLTIAAPPVNNGLGSPRNLDLPNLPVDFINVMDYDIHGSPWEPSMTNNAAALTQDIANEPTGAPLYGDDSVSDSIRDYAQDFGPGQLAALLMGIPMYGYAWQGVGPGPVAGSPGLYATAGGPLPNAYGGDAGNFTYNTVGRLVADQAMTCSWNATYQFTTCYGQSSGSFLSYDDPTTVQAKARYIQQNPFGRLGGAMFWELSGDTIDANSLVYNVAQVLKPNTAVVPSPVPPVQAQLTNFDDTYWAAIDVNGVTFTLAPKGDPRHRDDVIVSNDASFALATVLLGGNGPYTVTYSHSGWGSTYTCSSPVQFGSGTGNTAHIMVNPSAPSCTIAYY